jgi:hypothetical protein
MKTLLWFAAASVCLIQAASAQEQNSFKGLMGRGFDIKGVTYARGESTENREVFVITMQKDKSVAVCFFSANAWINLTQNVLEDPKRCDVR